MPTQSVLVPAAISGLLALAAVVETLRALEVTVSRRAALGILAGAGVVFVASLGLYASP
jgi:hypothetical protein